MHTSWLGEQGVGLRGVLNFFVRLLGLGHVDGRCVGMGDTRRRLGLAEAAQGSTVMGAMAGDVL